MGELSQSAHSAGKSINGWKAGPAYSIESCFAANREERAFFILWIWYKIYAFYCSSIDTILLEFLQDFIVNLSPLNLFDFELIGSSNLEQGCGRT